MIQKQIPPGLAVIVLALGVSLISAVEWGALYRQDHPPPRTIDLAYCMQCHNTPAMIRKMKAKEGNTHFLFKDQDALKKALLACPAQDPKKTSASYHTDIWK